MEHTTTSEYIAANPLRPEAPLAKRINQRPRQFVETATQDTILENVTASQIYMSERGGDRNGSKRT